VTVISRSSALGLAALLLAPGGTAISRDGRVDAACWQRLETLALVQTLNARILASRSATATLEGWCAARGLAAEPNVRARLIAVPGRPPTQDQLDRLQVVSPEELRYRRVQLVCGEHVLSEADNWYVPARLTPEMNRLLETTDTPFGRAVQPLQPYRQTFSAELLWQPFGEGWERRSGAQLCGTAAELLAPPPFLFEHRAVLYDSARRPFSEVREHYSREILAPPEVH
jgi:chorismate-pyruvate lyase